MFATYHHNEMQARGSLVHCVNYLLLLCVFEGHSGNVKQLMDEGWEVRVWHIAK